jgi:hypothetical protein
MAVTPQRNASLNELAKAAVLADSDLQSMLRGMVRDAIGIGVHTLRHGSPTDKMALMKTLMPHMLEALRQTEQSERSQKEKEAYDRIRAELVGDLPSNDTP